MKHKGRTGNRRARRAPLGLAAVILAAGAFLSGAASWNSIQEAQVGPVRVENAAPALEEAGRPEEPAHTGLAAGTADDWRLILVNGDRPLPEEYTMELTQLKNGRCVDARCYPDLMRMIDACRGDGLSPVICSAYRSREKQETLYRNKVEQFVGRGYSRAQAEVEAGRVVAAPGTSEHQLGLAVDLVDIDNQNLDKSQEDTAVQKWLMENSWKYGFILRYPSDKSEITGIVYEPWHYRYVGTEAAKEIFEQGICLEEYLEQGAAA